MRLRWIALLALSTAACAQPRPGYEPSSTHIFPAGGRRGTTVPVLVGTEISPPGTRFTIARDSGVSVPPVLGTEVVDTGEPSSRRKPTEIPVTLPREWRSRMAIAATAPDVVFWRIGSAQGGAGWRPFVIGDLPEFIETESNSTLDTAQPLTLPVTVNGRINGERDLDYFRIRLQAGQIVHCNVLAARIGSRLDPIVEFIDAGGRTVDAAEHHVGSDPVIVFRAASAGDYCLRIGNVTHRGSPAHVYRIDVVAESQPLFAFPSTGQGGATRPVDFYVPTGDGGYRTVRRPVEFPAGRGAAFDFALEGSVTSATQTFRVTGIPTVVESDTNDESAVAMPLKLPVSIDGRFERRRDVDWFRFTAKQGERYAITCEPCRPISPALPEMQLTGADGRRLAFARGVQSPDGVCRIAWTATKAGEVRLRVADTGAASRGGPEFLYRLDVRRAEPDFHLSLKQMVVNVQQGETTEVPVAIDRRGGCDVPIAITVEGLPADVAVAKLNAPPDEKTVKLKFSAEKNARCRDLTIRIVGRARLGPRIVNRTAKLRHLGVDPRGVSIGPASTDRLPLTVRHKTLFRLYCPEAYLYAHRGSVFQYPMQIERLGGFNGPVTVQRGDRQNRDMDGIEFFTTTVPAGNRDFFQPIYLPESMHINVQSQSQLYAQAIATFTDTHGQKQAVLVLSEKRNMLRTRPPVAKLRAVDRIDASPGRTVRVPLKLDRTSNFPGPMQIALHRVEPQDAATETTPVELAAGETTATIAVRIASTVRPGAKLKLTFRGIGNLYGRIRIVSEATTMMTIGPVQTTAVEATRP